MIRSRGSIDESTCIRNICRNISMYFINIIQQNIKVCRFSLSVCRSVLNIFGQKKEKRRIDIINRKEVRSALSVCTLHNAYKCRKMMMFADTEKSFFGKNLCHVSNTIDLPVVNINIIKISSITADFKQIPTRLKIKN